MPRVQRPAPIHLAAPVSAVRDAAVAELDATVQDDQTLRTGVAPDAEPGVAQLLHLESNGAGTNVGIEAVGRIDIPFFAWFFGRCSLSRTDARRYIPRRSCATRSKAAHRLPRQNR